MTYYSIRLQMDEKGMKKKTSSKSPDAICNW